MNQEDEFYDEKLNELKYGGGIWNILSSVLQVGVEKWIEDSWHLSKNKGLFTVEVVFCVNKRI